MATVQTIIKKILQLSEKQREGYAFDEGNDILKIMESGKRISFVFIILGLLHCCCENGIDLKDLYEPEVIFAGYFNDTYDSLTGNWQYPNTCRMVGDTIRIYCYSAFFGESNRIRNGDLMRLDLYPDTSEDAYQKGHILFHLARYYDSNESYTINSADTADVRINFKSQTESFSHRRGGSFELDEIYVSTPPVGHGRYLEIQRGHLIGSVH